MIKIQVLVPIRLFVLKFFFCMIHTVNYWVASTKLNEKEGEFDGCRTGFLYLIPKLMLFKPEKVCVLLKHGLKANPSKRTLRCVFGLKAEHGTRSRKYHFVETICYSTTTQAKRLWHLKVPIMWVFGSAEPSNPTTGKHVIHPSQNYWCEFLWLMERFWRPLVPVSVVSFFHINITCIYN